MMLAIVASRIESVTYFIFLDFQFSFFDETIKIEKMFKPREITLLKIVIFDYYIYIYIRSDFRQNGKKKSTINNNNIVEKDKISTYINNNS